MSTLTREQVERLVEFAMDSAQLDVERDTILAHDASQRERIESLEKQNELLSGASIGYATDLAAMKTSHDNLFALLTARNADLAAMTQECHELRRVFPIGTELVAAQRRMAQLEAALNVCLEHFQFILVYPGSTGPQTLRDITHLVEQAQHALESK